MVRINRLKLKLYWTTGATSDHRSPMKSLNMSDWYHYHVLHGNKEKGGCELWWSDWDRLSDIVGLIGLQWFELAAVLRQSLSSAWLPSTRVLFLLVFRPHPQAPPDAPIESIFVFYAEKFAQKWDGDIPRKTLRRLPKHEWNWIMGWRCQYVWVMLYHQCKSNSQIFTSHSCTTDWSNGWLRQDHNYTK